MVELPDNNYDDDDEDENLRDDDIEYTKKSEFSKAKVVEDAIRKVEECRSQEMKEGYYNYSTSPNGDMKKVYIPDSRKEFIGAVESLISILTPEIRRSNEMVKVLEYFKKNKQELFDKYAIKRIFKNGNGLKEGESYIPNIDDETPSMITQLDTRGFKLGSKVNYDKGVYNYNANSYWDGIVELYDFLFAELNVLISSKKVNFFKQGASF